MKKILSILCVVLLIGIIAANLIACNKVTEYIYSSEELIKLKEKNKIKTNNQEIINNLEGIAPQEKPFDIIDNKYYFVVWRGMSDNDGKIKLFKNINFYKSKILDTQDKYELRLSKAGDKLFRIKKDNVRPVTSWPKDNGIYFKSIYRGKLDKNIPVLIVDKKTGKLKIK